MRRIMKDACVVSGVAAVTAAAVFAVARPRTVVAEGEAKAAPVERPALKVDGVVLTLELDKQKYEAGEKPKLTLKAVNTRSEPASIDAAVLMLVRPPAPMMSRMMPASKEAWRHECALGLGAGETKAVDLIAERALAAGESATFNMSVGRKGIAAAWLAVPGPNGAGGPIVLNAIRASNAAKLLAAAEKAKAQPADAPSAAKAEAGAK